MRSILTLLPALGLMLGTPLLHAADIDAGKARYQQLCASCHGATGEGDGPAARGLRPAPRDMRDADWQNEVDDEYLAKVIAEGGRAVGLAPTMAGFGHALRGDDLDNVIAFIRSLKEE